jgi:hypothetical protein
VSDQNPYRAPSELPQKRTAAQIVLAFVLGLVGIFYAFIGWAAIIAFTHSYLWWKFREPDPRELHAVGIEASLFIAAFGGTCLVFAAGGAYRGAGKIALVLAVVGIVVVVTGHFMPRYFFETSTR